MKLKALMIAGLFAVSASANAGGAASGYTIHKVDNLKLKVKAADADGKGVTENVKDKDVVDLLCDTTPDKAELVVLAPCPIQAPEGTVLLRVWDKQANDGDGDFAASCATEACDYYAPVVETKNGSPKKARGVLDCVVGPAEFAASVDVDFSELKIGDASLDGVTCFGKVKSKSLLGLVDGGEAGDAIIQKGVLKAGKVQGVSTEIFD